MNTLHLRSTLGSVLLLFAAGRYLAAQSITTMPLERGQYCAEDSITVSFKATGTFGANNRFIAQLSTKDGSFGSGFTNLGTLSGTGSGTIGGVIPANIADGAKYRVRVIALTPDITGTDNGADVTMGSRRRAYVQYERRQVRNMQVVVGFPVHLNTSIPKEIDVSWDFGDGAVPRTSTARDTVTVTYTTPGAKRIVLLAKNWTGCEEANVVDVSVYPQSPRIDGSAMVISRDTTIQVLDMDRSGSGKVWVCSGVTLTASEIEHAEVYAERGATINVTTMASQSAIYLKKSAAFSSESYYDAIIIHEPGAGYTPNQLNGTYAYEVPTLVFDYSGAPAGGCPEIIAGVAGPARQSSLTLRPNPATGSVTITAADDARFTGAIVVINALGQELMHVDAGAKAAVEIPLAGLHSGTYFVRAETNRGRRVERLVVR